MRREPGKGGEVNGEAKEANNRDRRKFCTAGDRNAKKKSRSSVWELLGISQLHKRWHRQDLKKKERKSPLHQPPTSYRSDFEVSYNTSLRSAIASLLLKRSIISCEQYFDVLEMHMGLMQCGD